MLIYPNLIGLNIEKQFKFSVFMNLLKELREGSKILVEELRDYRKNWEDYPQNRKILTDNLSTKLTKYS
ncbi:hypothetical protein MUO66_01350 [Candidatus Bathyarchaeota archaeon]|nr:hypothetical protein [Candidatus Bathyarchaeota archaeon]